MLINIYLVKAKMQDSGTLINLVLASHTAAALLTVKDWLFLCIPKATSCKPEHVFKKVSHASLSIYIWQKSQVVQSWIW